MSYNHLQTTLDRLSPTKIVLIFLNGRKGAVVYVWFGLSDLIASFGPLSDGGFDRLFLGLGPLWELKRDLHFVIGEKR